MECRHPQGCPSYLCGCACKTCRIHQFLNPHEMLCQFPRADVMTYRKSFARVTCPECISALRAKGIRETAWLG